MAGIYYLYHRLQVWTVQGAGKMCISYQSVKTSRDNFLLCPPARLWNVAGVSDWCFYDTPVACSSIQPRKNALLDISIINHSELESRGLQGLETANQDNIHTQEIFSCFVVCVLNWWSFGRFPIQSNVLGFENEQLCLKSSDEKGKKSVLHMYKCQAWVSSNNSSIRLCSLNTSQLMRSLEHQLCALSAQTQRPSHFALLHFHSPFAISVCGALCDCAPFKLFFLLPFWSGCFLRSCLNWIPDTLPQQPEQHSQNNLTLCSLQLFVHRYWNNFVLGIKSTFSCLLSGRIAGQTWRVTLYISKTANFKFI